MILVPFWVLQMALALGLVGLFVYRLSDSMIQCEERDRPKEPWPVMELV